MLTEEEDRALRAASVAGYFLEFNHWANAGLQGAADREGVLRVASELLCRPVDKRELAVGLVNMFAPGQYLEVSGREGEACSGAWQNYIDGDLT